MLLFLYFNNLRGNLVHLLSKHTVKGKIWLNFFFQIVEKNDDDFQRSGNDRLKLFEYSTRHFANTLSKPFEFKPICLVWFFSASLQFGRESLEFIVIAPKITVLSIKCNTAGKVKVMKL